MISLDGDNGYTFLNTLIIALAALSAIGLVWLIARIPKEPAIKQPEEKPMEKVKIEITNAQCRHLMSVIQLDSLSGNKESIDLYNDLLKQLWEQVKKK